MASAPQYAATPITDAVQISTANANRNGSGSLGTLLTAGANGTRVDDIYFKATGATTAGMIRLFACSSPTSYLIKEVPVAAVTPSASEATWFSELTDLGIVLQSGWDLKVSTENAETFNVVVTRGGNF